MIRKMQLQKRKRRERRNTRWSVTGKTTRTGISPIHSTVELALCFTRCKEGLSSSRRMSLYSQRRIWTRLARPKNWQLVQGSWSRISVFKRAVFWSSPKACWLTQLRFSQIPTCATEASWFMRQAPILIEVTRAAKRRRVQRDSLRAVLQLEMPLWPRISLEIRKLSRDNSITARCTRVSASQDSIKAKIGTIRWLRWGLWSVRSNLGRLDKYSALITITAIVLIFATLERILDI